MWYLKWANNTINLHSFIVLPGYKMQVQPSHQLSAEKLISDRIFQIRDKLLNRLLLISLTLGAISVLLSVLRFSYTGFQFTYVVQILSYCTIVFLYIFRKKVHFNVRLSSQIILAFAIAITGLLNFGLFSSAIYFFSIAAIIASVFSSQRISVVVIFCGIILIILFMYLFLAGYVKITFDTDSYVAKPFSWIQNLISYVMLTGIAVTITVGLFQSVRSLAIENMQRVIEIGKMNEILEQKVVQRTKDLEQSNKDKDRIMSVVAHDLINNISANVSIIDILKMDADDNTNKEQIEYFELMSQASSNAIEIVKDLLEYARLRNFGVQLHTESVDMVPFIRSVVASHYPRAIKKGITLEIHNEDAHLQCTVNKSQITRVFDNLLVNAIKFTHNGGKVHVTILKKDSHIVIEVRDTGIGIPDNLKDGIFIPFTSSGREGTSREQSTGLGLSIAKDIVEKYSGEIWFESVEGEGTSFFVKLLLE